VNGAYLAKSGLKVLVLERRHLVGGAAITEELRPGFWFTTFSYALSLLRPEIIHDLELVKHGFMPLLMSNTFAPGLDGEYLMFTQDHGQNQQEIARHSKHDADAYDQYSHDMEMVCQAIKPLLDMVPPDIFSDDPEEMIALANVGSRFKKMDKRVLHNAVRLLTGSAADFLDDYFESDLLKGYLSSSSIIGTKVGPRSQGSGLVLLYHSIGEHDGEFGAWAFHKKGNGGFTQVLARAAESFGAEIRLESPVDSVITKDGRATGVALQDGTEFYADTVVSALDPRRTFLSSSTRASYPTTSSRTSSGSGSRARARRSTSRSTGCRRSATSTAASSVASPTSARRWITWSGPSTTPSTAGIRRTRISTARSSRRSTPTWRLPANTSCRASSSTRRTSFARATGTPRRRTSATPCSGRSSASSRASVISCFSARSDAARHRADRRPLRGEHLRRRVLRSADVLLPACPGWSQYRTPIDGYYQCGSGTHPGGCVMGAPGKLAAGQILKDRAKVGAASGKTRVAARA
jgi:phytoene dehydrogenase-like protein